MRVFHHILMIQLAGNWNGKVGDDEDGILSSKTSL
jgi:hypothetical protein